MNINNFEDFDSIDLDDMDNTQSFDMSNKSIFVEEESTTFLEKEKKKHKVTGMGVSKHLLELYKDYSLLKLNTEKELTGAILKNIILHGIQNCKVLDFPKFTYEKKLFFVEANDLRNAFEASNEELFPFTTTITSHHHAYAIEALKILIKTEKGQ
ncbi:hypothetical protein [Vibrio aestuarianus]|uniref:hypothetical protein n=1 Tax=Vibrio aestuarianus TaxID=28171 RepID=UPI00237CF0D3|nr:hypothetical protein [Vibrio aestuarianus]MDE1271048.1 hypothetical protein [Vibrio aestuarianus]MDH5893448.1 hypothetical protein [Vibrio aestuarianus]WDS56164.1 hypothetical protein MCL29_15330 [Vibrio aestuarianus]WDS59831.1 hypothetical protein MCL31_19730 [Vibrio aestuarianus]